MRTYIYQEFFYHTVFGQCINMLNYNIIRVTDVKDQEMHALPVE